MMKMSRIDSIIGVLHKLRFSLRSILIIFSYFIVGSNTAYAIPVNVTESFDFGNVPVGVSELKVVFSGGPQIYPSMFQYSLTYSLDPSSDPDFKIYSFTCLDTIPSPAVPSIFHVCSIVISFLGLAPDLVELSEREVFVIHPTFVSKSIFSAVVVISLI